MRKPPIFGISYQSPEHLIKTSDFLANRLLNKHLRQQGVSAQQSTKYIDDAKHLREAYLREQVPYQNNKELGEFFLDEYIKAKPIMRGSKGEGKELFNQATTSNPYVSVPLEELAFTSDSWSRGFSNARALGGPTLQKHLARYYQPELKEQIYRGSILSNEFLSKVQAGQPFYRRGFQGFSDSPLIASSFAGGGYEWHTPGKNARVIFGAKGDFHDIRSRNQKEAELLAVPGSIFQAQSSPVVIDFDTKNVRLPREFPSDRKKELSKLIENLERIREGEYYYIPVSQSGSI